MKIVVAGGGGFLGRALVEELSLIASEIVVISRSNSAIPNARTVEWDGESLGLWAAELEEAHAVINYAGSPILSRWTKRNKLAILDSRVKSTQAIGVAVAAAKNPPKVWINGSATGFYGNRDGKELTEESQPGSGFLSQVCEAWEAATLESSTPNTKVVLLRTGVVFDRAHPPLSLLIRLTKLCLGGAVGSGKAYLPWIHVSDHARIVRFCIEKGLEGPVNAVAPEPLTNGELMALLRLGLHRPWSPPVPTFLLKFLGLFGFPSEAILSSCRAVPTALEAVGFRWLCRKPDHALGKLPGRTKR